jgi:hypothetical protein
VKPSRTSRFLALSIVAAGILTFFYPFVTTDPPVAGAARWSSFGIVLQMYNGVLPAPVCERCGEPLIRTFLALPLLVTIEYFFMVAAGLALCSNKSARLTVWIAAFGIYNCLRGEYGVATRLEFEGTFFGLSRSGHVVHGGLLAAHLVVMVALFLASLDLRDEASAEETRERNRIPVEPAGAPVIDAEVVEENEGVKGARRNPPRLHD